MIPVNPAGPPAGFAVKVARPAKAWAALKGWHWAAPPPAGHAHELPSYWTKYLGDLHAVHGGVCAYLSVYTHRSLQSSSVDHFVPKSKAPVSLAYTWSNYRLASRPMNANKGEFEDVLDPIGLPEGLFNLDLLSGRVQVSDTVAPVGSLLRAQAQDTVKRLKLNAGEFRGLRLRYIDEYLRSRELPVVQALQQARDTLKVQSPFIHCEVVRQGW